mgnify:CR=1 FL=1
MDVVGEVAVEVAAAPRTCRSCATAASFADLSSAAAGVRHGDARQIEVAKRALDFASARGAKLDGNAGTVVSRRLQFAVLRVVSDVRDLLQAQHEAAKKNSWTLAVKQAYNNLNQAQGPLPKKGTDVYTIAKMLQPDIKKELEEKKAAEAAKDEATATGDGADKDAAAADADKATAAAAVPSALAKDRAIDAEVFGEVASRAQQHLVRRLLLAPRLPSERRGRIAEGVTREALLIGRQHLEREQLGLERVQLARHRVDVRAGREAREEQRHGERQREDGAKHGFV